MSSSDSWKTQVCLGLGSNLGDSRHHLLQGIKGLRYNLTEVKVSSLYSSAPQEILDQPRFLNCALVGYWAGSLFQLLDLCRGLERKEGRTRDGSLRYGPRTLDIDILWANKIVLESPSLTVPHPKLTQRVFALLPLIELIPDAENPIKSTLLSENLKFLEDQGVYQVQW